ncbi:MAG: methyltransferase family protein [Candidatus Helarchaeota archaeon]
MSAINKSKEEREAPYAHLIHLGSAVTIGILSVLDGLVFKITAKITGFNPPWWVGLGVGIFLLILALPFMIKSHSALFSEKTDAPDHLITDGIFDQTRNPMYFAIILIFLAVVAFAMSLLAFIAWWIIVLVYNWLVNYEEKVLLTIFPEDYDEYKKRTSKWIPR